MVVEQARRGPQGVPGAGHPDIEQACVLGLLFDFPRTLGVVPVGIAERDVPVQAPLVAFVMGNAKPARHRILAADAGERQEHQRVLQALALVQGDDLDAARVKSEEHTSELQSLMRLSYAVFWLKKNNCT